MSMIIGVLITIICFVGMLISSIRASSARRKERRKGDLLKAVINCSHIGVTVTCEEGPILRANPSLSRMLGYTEDEIKDLGWRELSHPNDHGDAKEAVSALIRGKVLASTTFFCRYRKQDGGFLAAFVNVTYIPLSKGEWSGIQVAQIQDIDEFNRTWRRTPEERRQAIDSVIMDA